MSRSQFVAAVEPLRLGFKTSLEAAAALPIGKKEKSPLAKTVRTARKLLKVEAALWTFVYVEGIEPTNNTAEQALRTAVIWRRTSFGSQSQAGSEFVARILTLGDIPESTAAKSLGLSNRSDECQAIGLVRSIPITRD